MRRTGIVVELVKMPRMHRITGVIVFDYGAAQEGRVVSVFTDD
jgi:hypothetical protein